MPRPETRGCPESDDLESCASQRSRTAKADAMTGIDPQLVEQLRPLARVLLIQARRQLAAEARARMMSQERQREPDGHLRPGLLARAGRGRLLDRGPAGGLPPLRHREGLGHRGRVHRARRVRVHREPHRLQGHDSAARGARRHLLPRRAQDRSPRAEPRLLRSDQGALQEARHSACLRDRGHGGGSVRASRRRHHGRNRRVLFRTTWARRSARACSRSCAMAAGPTSLRLDTCTRASIGAAGAPSLFSLPIPNRRSWCERPSSYMPAANIRSPLSTSR